MEGKDPVKVIREGLGSFLLIAMAKECCCFIEVDADVSLERLGDRIRPPCPFLDEVLYNVLGSNGIIGCPLMLIQVN
ncbi:hypothetical protein FNV43_RR08391 [Rhamnella rubrinervis]|uniref:Uncharacterized protein n=1 Tax=Rhamnella rubrinervis TaxID=2594499 RepID=A0A8K0H988_9ROSA|nr:hypothetical protein FNV43_RR08391 [Rhamnella rubrinervis]